MSKAWRTKPLSVQAVPSPVNCAEAWGPFSKIAPQSQMTSRQRPTAATGSALRIRAPLGVIAVARLEALGHPGGDFRKFRRVADIECPHSAERTFDHIEDAPRPWAHHHNMRGKKHR